MFYAIVLQQFAALLALITALAVFPMMAVVNKLMEAVQGDGKSFPMGWEGILERATKNPVYQVAMREAKFSDMASALGGVHDIVWEAAKEAAIGREIINFFPTTEALVRFYKAKFGKAWHADEAPPLVTGERMEYKDILADIEIKYRAEWNQTYLEDANWAVLERDIAEAGYQIAELETADILALYEGITIADAAGGALMGCNDGTSFVWADIAKIWKVMRKEKFPCTDLILAIDEVEGLLGDDKFLNANYYAPEEIIRKGAPLNKVGSVSMLGMDIWCTSALTAAHKIALNKPAAAAMIVRRDATATPYEDPGEGIYGVAASERIGLEVLKSKAVGLDT